MVLIDHAGGYRFAPGTRRFLRRPGEARHPAKALLRRCQPSPRKCIAGWTHKGLRARSNIPFFNSCIAEAARISRVRTAESMPLIVIANSALAGLTDYQSKQAALLSNRGNKAMIARTRGHQVR